MLTPCAGCRRHVSTDAPTCPFCGAAVTAGPVPGSPAGRLGRAAFFAFGAAVASANLAGCSETHGPTDDAGTSSDAGGGATDAGVDAGHDAGGGIVPPYGAPPDDAGGPAPLYGGAPMD
ncbi:MAG: hypothetical protein R3B82_19390 [Sandaracinaceae bacterium]